MYKCCTVEINSTTKLYYNDYDGYSEEIPESTQEDKASESWPDHSVRDSTRDRKQEPRIQELEEDVDQQTSTAAMQGRGRGIRGIVE